MKNTIKISSVNFHAVWGNKEANLNKYVKIIESEAAKGTNLLVFPEMSLTSYDVELNKPSNETMQYKLAETIPGLSSNLIAEYTRKHHMYVVFGMPERDFDNDIIYNTACVCGPDGIIGAYRKIHLPFPETHWGTRGSHPFIFDTEWGPMGVSICYDTYCYPELIRYYCAKGCRLHINPTALAECHGNSQMNLALPFNAGTNSMFIISSNLVGLDVDNTFWGCSSIVGPDEGFLAAKYYAGNIFGDKNGFCEKIVSAELDLSKAQRTIFTPNPLIDNCTDYRPAIYKAMMDDLLTMDIYQEN